MNGSYVSNDRPSAYDCLYREIINGQVVRDVLPNPSYDFAEERQARYFTNMRWNMESDIAEKIMSRGHDCAELILLKEWK